MSQFFHILSTDFTVNSFLEGNTFFWGNSHTENWKKTHFKYSWYEYTLIWRSQKTSTTKDTYQFMSINWKQILVCQYVFPITLYIDVLEWELPGSCSTSESDKNNDNRYSAVAVWKKTFLNAQTRQQKHTNYWKRERLIVGVKEKRLKGGDWTTRQLCLAVFLSPSNTPTSVLF